MIFGRPLYWRETQRPVKFIIFDGVIVVFLMLALMHLRVWTLLLVVVVAFVLLYFSRKGISSSDIARFLKAKLAGNHRAARPVNLIRATVDYGFENEAMVQREKDFAAARTESAKLAKAKRAKKRKA